MTRRAATVPRWWDSVLREILDLPALDVPSLRPFVSRLRTLSTHLNAVEERSGRLSTYMQQRAARETYLLYYATANLLKPLWVLDQLWPDGPPPADSPLRVLDLGCGPGTGVAALHAWMERAPLPRPLAVEGLDSSEANATLYRRVAEAARVHTGVDLSCDARQGDAVRPPGEAASRDLVMGLNLLNEIPGQAHEAFLARCREVLAPGGVLLLVEPALRATSRALLRLRDQAVREGWQVLVPCFRQADCPALAHDKDWCHHDLPWERPSYVAWLDEEVGNVKRSLKFSCIALRSGRTTAGDTASPDNNDGADAGDARRLRVVSELFVEKGRTWCHCCGSDGRKVYQRNRRDRSEANGGFDQCARYDTLLVEGAEDRVHDVRITAETTVRLSH